MRPLSASMRPLWLLCAGLALAAIGLALEPRPQAGGQGTTPLVPGNNSTAAPNTALGAFGSYGTADSNGRMIAVTGVDITGASLLYLIDTETRHLSVYQATGGSDATSRLRWVGARNIDLDLKVDGYNDKSEYSFKVLEDKFNKGETTPGK